jgi:aspartate carbamoyltransferase catalytic subunit
MTVNFEGRHILSLRDFTREEMDYIFDVTAWMEPIAEKHTKLDILRDKILAALFFQASTRTRLSFESAMQRLGGSVIGFASPEASRSGDQYKETFGDTARVLNGYVDAVVMRHFQVGAPADYASYSSVPMINGGDGFGQDSEHPTQALRHVHHQEAARLHRRHEDLDCRGWSFSDDPFLRFCLSEVQEH